MAHGIMQHDSMFSVREMPWHGLGSILEEAPSGIDDALEKSGLGWEVAQRPLYVAGPATYQPSLPPGSTGTYVPELESRLKLADGFKANVREDTGDVLGIVSDDYSVVQNRDAFRFLDTLIGSELHFETAGSLFNGKRAWVLARLPEFVEVGGDQVATYIYVANSHDGSLAVTAAVSPIRIVCANTLGMALRRADRDAARTFKFRHVGDLQEKFEEARTVLDLTVNYEAQFKALGDKLATEHFSAGQMGAVARKLVEADEPGLGDRALKNRQKAADSILGIFHGNGPGGDTSGNAPYTKWCAINAIGEFADWGRRYTKRTDQVQRSFEDADLKTRGLELVLAAD